MVYHEPSNILWMSFYEDDMQFGKLNLEEVLKKGKKIDTAAKQDKKKSISRDDASDDSVIYGKVPPFYMLETNLQDTLTRFGF